MVFRFGATNLPERIEHGPDSRHVFLPFDDVLIIDVNLVDKPFLTIDFLIVNPGRAVVEVGVTDCNPVLYWVTIENV